METTFAETLRRLRLENNLSQQQLANKLFVDRSTIAHWERGSRMPDPVFMSRLAIILGADISSLLDMAATETSTPNVIIVDDEEIMLAGAIPILCETMPGAHIIGFTKASEAISYAKDNLVSIAFLDIEIGQTSGLDLCNRLIDIHPLINVIFLTSYPDYAIKAWETAASGFLVKPLRRENVLEQLKKLRNPVRGLE